MPEETKTEQNIKNPFDLIDNQKNNSQNENKNQKPDFMKNFMKKLAKRFWYPDPETWELNKKKDNQPNENIKSNENIDTVNTKSTLEQDIETEEKKEEKKNFNFENVMSWVSWVLDKIEKKIEDKTWIDFDAPLKRREERLANEWKNNEGKWIGTENQSIEDEIEKNNEDYLNK